MDCYYFAYGSNLDGQFPGVSSVGPAWLPDKELACRYTSSERRGGVFDVCDRIGQATAGWLFSVTDDAWVGLDSKDEASKYSRRFSWFAIEPCGQHVAVETYEVIREKRGSFVLPNNEYLKTVRAGRRKHRIPDDGHLDAVSKNASCPWYTPYVFVYGTCRPKQSRFEVLNRHGIKELRKGTVNGTLLDFGAWPGLIEGTTPIQGELVRSANLSDLLRALDEIEGFDGWCGAGHLFRRTLRKIETDTGLVNAWLYDYAGRERSAKIIATGDWFLRKK